MQKNIIETAIKESKLSKENQERVRKVLIDGKSQSEVAREAGIERATVSVAVKRIKAILKSSAGLPSGWKIVTVALPDEVAKEVMEREKAEKIKAGILFEKK